MNMSNQDAKWNKDVESQINGLRKVKGWLKQQKNDKKYPWSWEDEVRLARAICYLDLAVLETYSLQFRTPKENRNFKRDER
jgi:hypothetical protein